MEPFGLQPWDFAEESPQIISKFHVKVPSMVCTIEFAWVDLGHPNPGLYRQYLPNVDKSAPLVDPGDPMAMHDWIAWVGLGGPDPSLY